MTDGEGAPPAAPARSECEPHRAGVVALLGPPNSGKSALLNRLVGEKVAIVSAKPQTTRGRVLGILSRPGAQLLFLDTPGLHRATRTLNLALNECVQDVAKSCDVALLLVDLSSGWQPAHDRLYGGLRARATPLVLVGTKADLGRAGGARWQPAEVWQEGHPALEVSSRTGAGLGELLKTIVPLLPVSPPLYPVDEITDRPLRWLCGELVREAAFEELAQELPYAVAVEVIDFDESQPGLTRIRANLLVARSSQKRIVVGAGGQMVRDIGRRARPGIEKLLRSRVYLELWVKVDPRWLRTRKRLRQLGYA